MNLLAKTFQRLDYTYSVINEEKVYAFNTVYVSIPKKDGGKKTWVITRSVQPNKIAHVVECVVKSKSDIEYGFDGRSLNKLYYNDMEFAKAIARVEKIVSKAEQNENR